MHITGSDVENYTINWKGNYLKYGKHLGASREPKYFEGERIIIREIPAKNRLIASYTDVNYTVKNTAHIFLPINNISAKYIVALLNSKLMGFYFVNKFSERDGVFPKAKIGQCRLLPIKLCDEEKQNVIIGIVNEIINIKETEPTKDIKHLEKELDQMVYELYGLSEEEIKIVEEN